MENAKLPRREHENEPIVNDFGDGRSTAPLQHPAAGSRFITVNRKLFLRWLGTMEIFVTLVTYVNWGVLGT